MRLILSFLKIVFYLFIGFIFIILISQLLIYIISEFFGATKINLTNNKLLVKTKIICIYKDKNITVLDNNNYIKQLSVNDSSKVNIKINKNMERDIYIENQSIKLETDKDSMRILNSSSKKIGGWMGIKIEDRELNNFFVNNKKEFTFDSYKIK